MKSGSIVFLFLLCTQLGFAKCKPVALRLVSATLQNFNGGTEGSPSGTNFKLKFIAPASSKTLQIDQLWIGDKYYEVQVASEKSQIFSNTFKKGDTIFIAAVEANSNPIYGNQLQQVTPKIIVAKPIDYNGAAVVGYKLGKKRKYITVEKFEVLKRFNYQ